MVPKKEKKKQPRSVRLWHPMSLEQNRDNPIIFQSDTIIGDLVSNHPELAFHKERTDILEHISVHVVILILYIICNCTSTCREQGFVFPFKEKPFKLQTMSVSPCQLHNFHKHFPDKHPSEAKELNNGKVPYNLKTFDLTFNTTASDQLNKPDTLGLGCPLPDMTKHFYLCWLKMVMFILPVNEDGHFQFSSTQDTNVSTLDPFTQILKRCTNHPPYKIPTLTCEDSANLVDSSVAMLDQVNPPHCLTQDTNVHLINPFLSSPPKVNPSQQSFKEALAHFDSVSFDQISYMNLNHLCVAAHNIHCVFNLPENLGHIQPEVSKYYSTLPNYHPMPPFKERPNSWKKADILQPYALSPQANRTYVPNNIFFPISILNNNRENGSSYFSWAVLVVYTSLSFVTINYHADLSEVNWDNINSYQPLPTYITRENIIFIQTCNNKNCYRNSPPAKHTTTLTVINNSISTAQEELTLSVTTNLPPAKHTTASKVTNLFPPEAQEKTRSKYIWIMKGVAHCRHFKMWIKNKEGICQMVFLKQTVIVTHEDDKIWLKEGIYVIMETTYHHHHQFQICIKKRLVHMVLLKGAIILGTTCHRHQFKKIKEGICQTVSFKWTILLTRQHVKIVLKEGI
eukprot:jgi/Psemu1/6880/gm1.6880_g